MPRVARPVSQPRSTAPFVGRTEQQAWLRRALAAALDGRPRLVLVVGEPGIGKTRLLRELQADPLARAVSCCAGRGYEDMHLPFLPFAQALTPHLRAPSASLRRSLGQDAELVLRLFLVSATPDDVVAPERERVVLAVSRAILALAKRRPMLLVLDDVHWLDQASVELLAHLVVTVSDAAAYDRVPILIVAAMRPLEPDDRLARIVARFQREAICETVELGPLDELAVRGLVRGLGIGRPTHQLVANVVGVTGGNPQFVQEVVHQLLRENAVAARGGAATAEATALEVPLPADLAAAVTARARDLEPGARDVLTLAAFLGDPFSMEALTAVATSGEHTLHAILQEAERRHLIAVHGRDYQFAHPLVRHMFYAAPAPAARQLLHARIASALTARWGDTSDAHLLEIAHHVVAAGPTVAPPVVVDVARRAADRAFASAAWSDAARYYEAAVSAAGLARLPARELAYLHYRAGFAHYREQDAGPCLDHYERAIAAYRECGDDRGLARALMGRTRAQFTLASVGYGELIDPTALEDVAGRLGTTDPVLCGMIWSELAQVFWTARQPDRAVVMAERALEVAERHEADALAAEAHRALALVRSQRLEVPEALHHLETGLAHARRADDPWLESQLMQRIPLALVWLGRLREVPDVEDEGARLTRRLHDWGDRSLALGALVCAHVACGDFAAAERHAQEAATLWQRSGYPWAGPTVLPALARGYALRGMWTEADDALAGLVEAGRVFEKPGAVIQMATHVYRQLVHASRDGDAADRAATAERIAPALSSMMAAVMEDVYGLGVACAAVELADSGNVPDLAASAYDGLVRATERHVVFATGWVALLARVLGTAASTMRRWDAAATWFETAVEQARVRRARPELAQAQLAWARMLRARGRRSDRDAAAQLVTAAVAAFRELAMDPFVAERDALLGTVSAGRPRGARRATGRRLVTVLFTDVEGSSLLFDRLGDASARAVLRTHDMLARAWLRRTGGVPVKHTGDGVMASFDSADAALACAVGLQRAFAEHNRSSPEHALHVRIGLNAGEPVAEDGDLFGAAVTVAARICAHARPGRILVADVVRDLARDPAVAFIDCGRVSLRGFRRRFHLFEVTS
jgi:class 3 adenylate cyclase